MIFHDNRLLADDSHVISYLIFCRKLGKMLPNLSSTVVVIGALRVNMVFPNDGPWSEWSPLSVFNYFILPFMPLNVVLREIKCEGVKNVYSF